MSRVIGFTANERLASALPSPPMTLRMPTIGVVMMNTPTMNAAANARRPVSDATSSAIAARTSARMKAPTRPGPMSPSSFMAPENPSVRVKTAPMYMSSCGTASSSRITVARAVYFARA
ncbi:hypothetical protein GCM10027610_143540 [Dactylosporangium cerinum]